MVYSSPEMKRGHNVQQTSEITIRKAVIADVPKMTELINGYAAQGIMLPRSQHQLYQSLRDFAVAVDGHGEVIGCGALHIVWADLCEVRSLAVREEWRGNGVGRRLAERLVAEAAELGLPKVFVLTYQVDFFAGLGFRIVAHETLPHKIWGDCLNCPKYPNCDEIAMVRDIGPDPATKQEESR